MSDESDFEDEDEDAKTIIMDNGSFTTRIGFAGNAKPKVFDTAIGSKISDKEKTYIGQELLDNKQCKDISSIYPIKKGICSNFDALESIWNYAFCNVLNVDMPDSILITEPILHPKKNRQKYAEILFEKFNTGQIYLALQSLLALIASGRYTGLVVYSGYETTEIVPIYEGLALNSNKCDYGGKQCTQYLQTLLFESKSEKYNQYDIHFDDIRGIKENFGYIALDPNTEKKKPVCDNTKWLIPAYLRNIDYNYYCDHTPMEIEQFCTNYCGDFNEFMRITKEYKLPDGNTVKVRGEQFKCTELLFNPLLIDIDDKGIVEKIVITTNKMDHEVKRDYLSNIILCGGNSMLNGFENRLKKELSLQLNYKHLNILHRAEQNYVWLGGAILGSKRNIGWIDAEQYDEHGPDVVNKMCENEYVYAV